MRYQRPSGMLHIWRTAEQMRSYKERYDKIKWHSDKELTLKVEHTQTSFQSKKQVR